MCTYQLYASTFNLPLPPHTQWRTTPTSSSHCSRNTVTVRALCWKPTLPLATPPGQLWLMQTPLSWMTLQSRNWLRNTMCPQHRCVALCTVSTLKICHPSAAKNLSFEAIGAGLKKTVEGDDYLEFSDGTLERFTVGA